MKIKQLLGILISILVISAAGLTVQAATSDAVKEKGIADGMASLYGSDYDQPYVAGESNVDKFTGAVSKREADLNLPGKNGLDLTLYRSFNGNALDGKYDYRKTMSQTVEKNGYVHPYNYRQNGVSKTAYVRFDTEYLIEDQFYTTEERLKNDYFDGKGNAYKRGKNLKDTNGTILMTRDKSVQPRNFYQKDYYDYRWYGSDQFDVEVGEGWSINMPSLMYMDDLYSETDLSDNPQPDKPPAEFKSYTKYYYEFKDEKGKVLDVSFGVRYQNTDDGVTEEIRQPHISDGTHYMVNIWGATQTHELGFSYTVKIDDGLGKSYYFAFKDPYNPGDAFVVAITDQYGNCIQYKKVTGGVEITDSMGRIVKVTDSGITVNGVQKVLYENTKKYDSNRDPNGYLDCFTERYFRVKKPVGNGTYETTEYMSKKKPIDMDATLVLNVPRLEREVAPTKYAVEYVYEEVPRHWQYVYKTVRSDDLAKYDYKDYQVVEQKVYDNYTTSSSTPTRSIAYEWTINTRATDVFDALKTLQETSVLPSGKKRWITSEHDRFGKLLAKETEVEDDRVNVYMEEYFYKYRYSEQDYVYTGAKERRALRRGMLMNTRTSKKGVIINSVDTAYDGRQRLTHQRNGEIEKKWTYDDNHYGILTEQVTPKNQNTNIITRNTLTADGKGVASSSVFEGSVLKSQTSFTYNPDGTVASKTESPNAGESYTTYYTYTYNADKSYQVITTAAVKDADGVSQNISTVQAYDSFGNLISERDGNGNTTQYQYDNLGRVTKKINPDGTYQTVSYNIAANTVTVTDENGNITTQDYRSDGKPDKIYLNNNTSDVVASYGYDSLGRQTSETAYKTLRGDTVSDTYEYDGFDRVMNQTSKENTAVLDKTTYTYEDNVEPLQNINNRTDVDISGSKYVVLTVWMTSHDLNHPDELDVYLNGTSVYQNKAVYERNPITVVLDTSGKSTLKVWCTSACKIAMSVRKDTTSVLAGGAKQKVTMKYQGDATYRKPDTVKLVDAAGNLLSEEYYTPNTSTLLNKNTYQYDYLSNVLQTRGGRVEMENLAPCSTKTEYNYQNQPVKVYNADGNYTTTEYDKLGRAISATDYLGNTTTNEYDALGRVIKTVTPFENTATTEAINYYDANGNVIKTKQQNNKPGEAVSYAITENEYDSRNRLITTKVNDGERDIYTQYAYDNVGNMVKMVTGQTSKIADLFGTLPEGVTWQNYEYDRFGNVTKQTDALGQSMEVDEYNLMGLPSSYTDKNGNWITRSYNAYGSLMGEIKTGNDREVITNEYSANNLLNKSIKHNFGTHETDTITYAYDKYGYLSKEENDGIVKTYTNDVDGNRKNFVLSARGGGGGQDGVGEVMNASYTYTKLNQPQTVTFTGTDTPGQTSYSYDANGRLLTETRGGITTSYGYNKTGMVTSMTNTPGTSYTYQYRLDGNQISRSAVTGVAAAETTQYTYNNLGQLKSETQNGWTASYDYDTRGNRITARITDQLGIDFKNQTGIKNYDYDANNRLLRETNVNGSTTKITNYEYDPNGNIVFKGLEKYEDSGSEAESIEMSIAGSGAATQEPLATFYAYNYQNQLIGMQSDSVLAEYKYDAAGRRSSKTVNGVTTNHIWDGSNIVYETEGSGAYKAAFYRGVHLIGSKAAGIALDYYLYDEKGSVTGMKTDTASSYRYEAFGIQVESGTSARYNPFRYTGEYTDEESGLIYLRNRYYAPNTGRFLTEDPAMDGLNWYVYCGNNPVNRVDPTGMWMEGDENLSRAAQFYIHYYTREWELARHEANMTYIRLQSDELTEEEISSLTQKNQMAVQNMENAHKQAEDIRSKDANGEIEATYYEVPLYSQGRKPMCQYYAAVMVENTGVENPLDQTGADKRAAEIESEGWLTVEFLGSIGPNDVSYETLNKALSYGPQRVGYSAGPGTGHMVVLSGVFRAEGHPDIVATVNSQGKGPWGDYRVQTIDEFKSWYLEDEYEENGRLTDITISQRR